jgi:hypothetical protein
MKASPSKPRAPRKGSAAAAAVVRYPHVSAGPFQHDAHTYEVRLEKVPGGLRLAEWRSGGLERNAPVLPASALRALVDEGREHGIVSFDQLPEPETGPVAEGMAASPGQAGDMREELRVERLAEPGLVRVARWVFWPGGGEGWLLQEAPVMAPESRFEQALSEAARNGLI